VSAADLAAGARRYHLPMHPLVRRLDRPIVAILAVAAIAGGIRLWHLSEPTTFVFDEVYYPKAGCIYVGWSDDVCRLRSADERYWRTNKWDVGSWVHPPLGKWMEALGIKAFGMRSFGWRVMPALEGTLVSVGVALMAWLLFGSTLWTFVAGLLMAVEHLNVVLSRVALLDIHLELWIVAGFLCLLLDRRWIDRETPVETEPIEITGPVGQVELVLPRASRIPSPVWRPWRFAAGVAFGAACAVKWSAITALGAAVLLSYLWEATRRHRDGRSVGRAFGRAVMMETFGIAIALVVVPAAVYMLTWIPWFHHFGWSLSGWWQNQGEMWRYHAGVKEFALDTATKTYTPTHPYYSRPWTWIPMTRPVSFYVLDLGPDIRQILAIGSPAVFWGTIGAMPYAAVVWWRRRDWRAGFVLVPFLVQWLAWFAVTRPQFFFYVLPCVPFMGLAITYLVRDLSDARIVVRDHETGAVATDPQTGRPVISSRHPYRPVAWIVVGAAVALFLWFWPVLTGGRISDTHWRAIVWLRSWV
jgi:dolichyl-phosphate-mannose-protein mannosyltransferase